jgi:tetratricopeptide (TPR) repeat protein
MWAQRRIPKCLLALRAKLRLIGCVGMAILFGVSCLCLWSQSAPDPMAEHYRAAQSALRAGDQETAAVEYKAFLAEAIHRAGNAEAQAGDLAGAARFLQEALTFSGNDETVRMDYASVLFDAGRFNDAEEPAQSVAADQPKNARAQLLLGKILFEEKNYAGSSTALQAASELGEFRQTWQTLALAYLRSEQLDRARAVLARMLATLGDTPQNRVAAAAVYYYGDHLDEAAEALKKVIAQHPSAPNAHYYLGLVYLARNEEAGYAKARPEFQAELSINPGDFRSRYMLGHMALEERHFAEAETELQKARSLNAADAGTQLSLGQLYSETNRPQQAEAVLRKLIQSWGDTAADFQLERAHYILGRVLRENGKLDEGAQEIKVAEDLRKQIRVRSSETEETRLKGPTGAGFGSEREFADKPTSASSADQARAHSFVTQISPLIGEAYYNLAGIALQHKDSGRAARYLHLAGQWDPSLAKVQPR